MNIYVGNLAFAITEDELRQAFEAFGKVDTATIVSPKGLVSSKWPPEMKPVPRSRA